MVPKVNTDLLLRPSSSFNFSYCDSIQDIHPIDFIMKMKTHGFEMGFYNDSHRMTFDVGKGVMVDELKNHRGTPNALVSQLDEYTLKAEIPDMSTYIQKADLDLDKINKLFNEDEIEVRQETHTTNIKFTASPYSAGPVIGIESVDDGLYGEWTFFGEGRIDAAINSSAIEQEYK